MIISEPSEVYLERCGVSTFNRTRAVPISGTNGAYRLKSDTTRAFWAGIIICSQSGSPIQSSFGLTDKTWLIIALVLQIFLCARGKPNLTRTRPLILTGIMYVVWTIIATLSGIDEQANGCVGMVLKLTLVAIPAMYLDKPLVGYIRSMAVICYISIVIFLIRQVGLLIGADIANLFGWFYKLSSVQENPSIFLFTFHWAGEEGRNSGFFREPGMFGANIEFALLLLIGYAKYLPVQEVKRYIVIFIIAILTTMSTDSLAALPILIFLVLPLIITKKQSRLVFFPLIIGVATIFLAILGFSQMEKIQSQLGVVSNTAYAQTSWYNTRFGNLEVDYDAIIERPLLGYGFKEAGRPGIFIFYKDNHFSAASDSNDLGFGDGLSGTMVKFGLVFTLALYLVFLFMLIDFYSNIYIAVAAWICLGIILFGQQVLLLPAIYIFLVRYNATNTKRWGVT